MISMFVAIAALLGAMCFFGNEVAEVLTRQVVLVSCGLAFLVSLPVALRSFSRLLREENDLTARRKAAYEEWCSLPPERASIIDDGKYVAFIEIQDGTNGREIRKIRLSLPSDCCTPA